jgi:hypothetical protein
MSTERIIQVADLTFILGALREVNSNVGAVSGQVQSVGQEVERTRGELLQLVQEFAAFRAADLKAKELALAETRLVKIAQELEVTYGYYATVRRHVTGILQAADIQLVRQDTIRSATEELMIAAPRYWLAPALVALASWLRDDRQLAERALAEALRRDDEKSSLFFALICRRAGRTEACRVWLDRYFALQNPLKLDRQTVVMIDAVTNGVFGPDTVMQYARRVESWIDELAQQPGFVDLQRKQWTDALKSKTPSDPHAQRYEHLARFSPTWPKLEQSLNDAARNAVALAHFQAIFNGPIQPLPSLLAAVDDLLTKLVSRFDDEELPLRRQEQLCRLIVAESGDRAVAQQQFDLQSKSLDEIVDFSQLLTNAAMHPEVSHASRATQRFAVAHSRSWAIAAHEDLSAAARIAVPSGIDIKIEGWSGTTSDGRDEQAQGALLAQHIQDREEQALSQATAGVKEWAALLFGILLLGSAVFGRQVVLAALGLGCVGWFAIARYQIGKTRARIKRDFAQLRSAAGQALKATLAEVVELRRDLAERDAKSAEVTAFLQSVSPSEHLLSPHDSVRRVAVSPR